MNKKPTKRKAVSKKTTSSSRRRKAATKTLSRKPLAQRRQTTRIVRVRAPRKVRTEAPVAVAPVAPVAVATLPPTNGNGHVQIIGAHGENGSHSPIPVERLIHIVPTVELTVEQPVITEPVITVEEPDEVEVIYRYNIRFEHYVPREKKFNHPLVIQPNRSPGDWQFKEFCTKLMKRGYECYVATVRANMDGIKVHDSSGIIPDTYDEDLGKFLKSLRTPIVLIGFAGGSTIANRVAHDNMSCIAGYISLMGNLIDWSRDRLIHPLPCRSLTIAQRNGLCPRWIHKWICSRLGSNLLILVRDNRGFIREQNRVGRMVNEISKWLEVNAPYLKSRK